MIVDLEAEEDALLMALQRSALPNRGLIETHLRRSAEEYGRNNNTSVTESRQALEQLLRDIAVVTVEARHEQPPTREEVRNYLEQCGFFTTEEKRGFSGIHGLLSAGPHPGIADPELARLGRNFALGASHYALQKFQIWAANGYRAF